MPSVLIIGATRGLGAALVTYYSSNPGTGTSWTIYATTRSSSPPTDTWAQKQNVHWLLNIDLEKGPDVAVNLAQQIEVKSDVDGDNADENTGRSGAKSGSSSKVNTVIITAGYFATEEFGSSKWDEQVKMYTLSSIAPVFVVEQLEKHNLLYDGTKDGQSGSKIILVSSESGSITLRHEQEGGGNYGHHASKAALNMVGKQLSFDLKEQGIAVGIVHPSFMRTEMTKGVGFDEYWVSGGALPPDEAAKILGEWVENKFSLDLTGTYWAPRGTRDIGNWEAVVGKDKQKEGPVQLPW